MTILTCMRLVDAYLPRLASRLVLAWISGFAAFHALASAGDDPCDLPPPLF